MSNEEILEKLKKIVEVVLKDRREIGNITPDTNLVEEYEIDSLATIEILVRVESEFDIEIDDDDLDFELLATPMVLINYIKMKKSLE